MLGAAADPAPEGLGSRLIVEPPAPAPEAAAANAAAAGIPQALLERFGASVRQTHQRANTVVLDVPPDRQSALAEALRAIGIAARPPHAIQPLLNDSVPLLHVPPLWDA